MPVIEGQRVRWGVMEKIVSGVLSAAILGATVTGIGLYVRMAVAEDHIRGVEADVEAVEAESTKDRQNRAVLDAKILEALNNINQNQIEQTAILADVQARMGAVEGDIRDAREERVRLRERMHDR